jgi:hypothetical protein
MIINGSDCVGNIGGRNEARFGTVLREGLAERRLDSYTEVFPWRLRWMHELGRKNSLDNAN